MKITVVHLAKPIGMSGSVDIKHFDFEITELGIIARPKGMVSFSKKLRLIPWANVAGCDLDEKEMNAEPAPPPAIEPVTAEDLSRDPEPVRADDTITFVKNPETGVISERRGPAPVPVVKFEKSDAAKSAFAKLREAKAEVTPE